LGDEVPSCLSGEGGACSATKNTFGGALTAALLF